MCVKSEQGMPNMSNLSIRMPLRIDKPINVMSKETLRQMAYKKGEKAKYGIAWRPSISKKFTGSRISNTGF